MLYMTQSVKKRGRCPTNSSVIESVWQFKSWIQFSFCLAKERLFLRLCIDNVWSTYVFDIDHTLYEIFKNAPRDTLFSHWFHCTSYYLSFRKKTSQCLTPLTRALLRAFFDVGEKLCEILECTSKGTVYICDIQ